MTLRILVEARYLTTAPHSSIARYERELVREWSSAPERPELILCAPGPRPTNLLAHDRITWWTPNALVSRLGRRPQGGRLWVNTVFSVAARLARPDVLFFPYPVVPYHLSAPAVVTVHDVCFRSFPEYADSGGGPLGARIRTSVRAARELVAVSQSCKDGVIETFGVDPARITVVHHGISSAFTATPSPLDAAILRKLDVEGAYILCVSTHEPRKNVDTLVNAFSGVLNDWPANRPLPSLVLVGRATSYTARLRVLAQVSGRIAHAVRFFESIAEAELAALYRRAIAVALPSTCEGFGFPLVEALASGTRVIASDLAVFRELVGDAECFVPPHDTAAWARAMRSMLTGEGGLAISAPPPLANYTWASAAKRTLEVVYRAATETV